MGQIEASQIGECDGTNHRADKSNQVSVANVKPPLMFRGLASTGMVRAEWQLVALMTSNLNRSDHTRDIMNKFAVLFCASLLFASAAHAQGFYAGGSVGIGDATVSPDTQFADVDDKLFVAKGIGGYRVNRFIAVESTLIAGTNDDFDDGFDGEADVSFAAVTASILGIIPVDDTFELYAKIGGYLGESEVDDDFFFFGGNNRDEDESGRVWGGGALFNFGSRKQFTIRVDYERFDTDALDEFWAVSGGFQYNF
jgi:hypothetical protein